MNKPLILTLLLAVNTYSFASEPLQTTQQQEQSWKNYLPTKKQVFIGACTIVAAGVAVWYMRKTNKAKPPFAFRPLEKPQSCGITQQPSASAAIQNPVTASTAQTQITFSSPAALSSPAMQPKTAVAKLSPLRVDLQDTVIACVSEKQYQQTPLPHKITGIGTVHTFGGSNHIKCFAYNRGRALEEFCFNTETQKILTITQGDCVHLRDQRILRNVDHILHHPTEITLGKRKVTFTGPWTVEIEG